jgi:hypothetical protein
MTLSALRTQFLENVGDPSQDVWTDVKANRLVNQAMHYVENLLVRYCPSALLWTTTVSVSNSGSDRVVLVDMGATLSNPNIRKLIRAENASISGDDKSLKVIEVFSADAEIQDTLTDRPDIFQWNNVLGFVSPQDSLTVRVWYVAELPDMAVDADEPGQSNDTPDLLNGELIPLPFQQLIPTYATVTALAGYNENTEVWERILSDQIRTALGAAREAQETSENGR